MGFTVSRYRDLNLSAFREAIRKEVAAATPSTTIVFYFCGHGCEAMNTDGSLSNYLIPADELGLTDHHMRMSAIDLGAVISAFSRKSYVLMLMSPVIGSP